LRVSRVCVDRPKTRRNISWRVRKRTEREEKKRQKRTIPIKTRVCADTEEGAKDISPGTVPVFKIHVQSLLP